MSRIKAWKQLNHIKNDDYKDNQSVLSQSRSTSSYRFSKVRFSKSKIDDDQSSVKNLGLGTISKAKQKYKDNSFLNDSKRRSRQNSLVQLLDREPIQLTLKSTSHRKFQMKVKKFLFNVKKIHQDLRQIGENILCSFQKIKEEMQFNLIKVTDELLKMGRDVKQIQNIHQIIDNGFRQIRKNIIILPISLTQFNNPSMTHLNNVSNNEIFVSKKGQQKVPLTPTLNLNQSQSLSKSKPKFSSIFSPKQNSPTTAKIIPVKFDSKQASNEKARPQTERKRQNLLASFDRSPEPTPQRNKVHVFDQTNYESTNNLQKLIKQMRQILNQEE